MRKPGRSGRRGDHRDQDAAPNCNPWPEGGQCRAAETVADGDRDAPKRRLQGSREHALLQAAPVQHEHDGGDRHHRHDDPPGFPDRRSAARRKPTRRRAIPFTSAHATTILGTSLECETSTKGQARPTQK